MTLIQPRTPSYRLALMAACLLMLSAFATVPAKAADAMVYHTVVFWLKPDTTAETVTEITQSVKALENLPMVEQVVVGTPMMSERDVVDDSFGVAFTMMFKDEAALQAYNDDPQHKKSSQKTLQHVVRGVIYDYKSE